MAEQFLIGDDGEITVDSTVLDSAESVTFNEERADISRRVRGSDLVQHRTGKLDRTVSVNMVIAPSDAGLAVIQSAIDTGDEVTLQVTSETGEDLCNANYEILSDSIEQPLEEGQTASVEFAYHSEISS